MLQWALPVGQAGLPSYLPDVVGIVAAAVFVLVLVAMVGFAYAMVTGGVDDTETVDDDDDGADELRTGGDDEEWEYY